MREEEPLENTYVLDPESPVELARLINLDRITTKSMGGPLSGVPLLPEAASVLDLACGPGGWVLDVAFARPDCEVAGIDISQSMVEYAKMRARSQQLLNASFEVMDIVHPLDFSDQTFDLVNARCLVMALKRESWPTLLAECRRILKPGGILRLTEPLDLAGYTTSTAYNELIHRFHQALFREGYGFSTEGYTLGMSTVLPHLLRHSGYQQVGVLTHALEFSEDCGEAWADMRQGIEAGIALGPPFLVKAGVTTEPEIHHLYQQAVIEMLAPTFCGMLHFASIIGTKPV